MSAPPPRPKSPAESVRTPVVASRRCPVCAKADLQGRQTACSAACRRERSRQRQLGGLRAAIVALRGGLDDLLTQVEALRGPRRAARRRTS
jgi:predicted nucleic acid-binding Zn ribbon protein